MPGRIVRAVVIAAACFAAAPAGPPSTAGTEELTQYDLTLPDAALPSSERFTELLRTDPIQAFAAVLRRCERDVRGFTATMHKQERLGSTTGPVEVVSVAYRHDPLAVYMQWAEPVGFLKPQRTLYVHGENGGRTRVRTSLTSANVDPLSGVSRSAARYSIADFGFYYTTLRTHRAWSASRDRGRFQFTFLGTRPVPECGDRVCHVIRRTCDPPEIDNFSLTEKGIIDPATNPPAAFHTVTLMFDSETWLQVGSVMTDASGGIVGAYYFRDVKLNPSFHRDQFTPAALQKK